KDPIRWQGDQENLYVYLGGDPANWVDPSGESWLIAGAVAVGAVIVDSVRIFLNAWDSSRRRYPYDDLDPFSERYRHCLASCELTQRYASGYAEALGDWHEEIGADPTHPNCDVDRANNREGREAGQDPETDCSLSCYGFAESL
ncbi:MAG: hypothetical protein RJA70_82, partial [Pseudomonadota bacterium]